MTKTWHLSPGDRVRLVNGDEAIIREVNHCGPSIWPGSPYPILGERVADGGHITWTNEGRVLRGVSNHAYNIAEVIYRPLLDLHPGDVVVLNDGHRCRITDLNYDHPDDLLRDVGFIIAGEPLEDDNGGLSWARYITGPLTWRVDGSYYWSNRHTDADDRPKDIQYNLTAAEVGVKVEAEFGSREEGVRSYRTRGGDIAVVLTHNAPDEEYPLAGYIVYGGELIADPTMWATDGRVAGSCIGDEDNDDIMFDTPAELGAYPDDAFDTTRPYRLRNGCHAVVLADNAPDNEYPLVGYYVNRDGSVSAESWTRQGNWLNYVNYHDYDLVYVDDADADEADEDEEQSGRSGYVVVYSDAAAVPYTGHEDGEEEPGARVPCRGADHWRSFPKRIWEEFGAEGDNSLVAIFRVTFSADADPTGWAVQPGDIMSWELVPEDEYKED